MSPFPPSVMVALTVVALAFLASGVALLVTPRGRLAGALLALAGAVGLAGVLLESRELHDARALALTVAGALLVPLAVTAYPVLRWQHPVDFVALAALLGCGGLSVAQWRNDVVMSSLGLTIGLILFAHTWFRIERGEGAERRALQWMALSAGTCGLIAGAAMFAADGSAGSGAGLGLFALVGPALYVGVAMPEIVDVRALVVRSVVLAVAVVTYLALFVALASLLELVGGRTLSIGALGLVGAVVALTFAPLQVVLRGVVDELLFGTRPDPLDAASRVVVGIGEDPVLALRAIRQALVLPYAAVVSGDEVLAASGMVTTQTRTFELEGGTRRLVVGLRPGDLTLSQDDLHVLRLTAPLLAQTLRARALAADLLEARGQAIGVIEEERRRLRRDLHDGLGPRLSGIAFQADAARNLLRIDPDAADELLRSLRRETVTAIDEIRQLVYAMRPPALDELGLVPALRQQATALRAQDGSPLTVTVSSPDHLPELSAAVEVAAYRIVLEALTNVSRHTSSPAATVLLSADPTGLRIRVADVGGPTQDWSAGVGLASMRERAVELGGTLVAGPGPTGGSVEAVLPLLP